MGYTTSNFLTISAVSDLRIPTHELMKSDRDGLDGRYSGLWMVVDVVENVVAVGWCVAPQC